MCCAVLCCAVLCCAVLRCAALCCAVLRCAALPKLELLSEQGRWLSTVQYIMQRPAVSDNLNGITFVFHRATMECCTMLTLKPRCQQNPTPVVAFESIHASPWGVTASGGLHPLYPDLMSQHPVSFLSSCFWHLLTALLSSSLRQW